MDHGKRKKILVVEDQAIIAISEANIIRKYGFEVETVYKGESAVDQIESDPEIGLILMDIDLGEGIDGTEAARRILDKRNLPIIFLTGHAEKEMVDRVKGISRYGYVLKNSGEFVLIESINMAFELFEAHQSLKEREERLELALEAGNLGTWDWHIKSDKIYFNNLWAEMKGYSTSEVQTSRQYWEKLMHPEDIDRVRSKMNEHLEGRTAFFEDEFRFKHKSGHWIWVKDRGKVVARDEHGNPLRFSGIHQNITDYKIIENRLYQQTLRSKWLSSIAHRLLLGWSVTDIIEYTVGEIAEHFPDYRVAYSTIDKNGKLQVLSSKQPVDMPDISGMESDLRQAPEYLSALRGDQALLISDLEKDKRVNPLKDAMTAGKTRALLDVPLLHADHVVGLLCFDSPFPHEWSEHEVLVLEEIADYLTLVLKNKHAQNKLEESEERYRNIFSEAPIGIATVSTDGTILTANPFFCNWLGYSLEELADLRVEDITVKEDFEWEQQSIQELADGQKKVTRIEKRYIKKDGSTVWGDLLTNILNREKDNDRFGLGMVIDITKRKEAEREIQQLLNEKDILIKEVHHRIKNDMGLIHSLISLQTSSSKNPNEIETLQELQKRIFVMRSIYDKLYTIPDFRHLHIKSFLTSLIDEIKQSHTLSKDITIQKHIEDLVVPAKQSFPIGIIVNELVTNAFKYAFTDSKAGKIHISVEKENTQFIRITVKDNGRGIPEETASNKTYGYGLTLIDGLTEQYGGSFSIEQVHGTKITAYLKLDYNSK